MLTQSHNVRSRGRQGAGGECRRGGGGQARRRRAGGGSTPSESMNGRHRRRRILGKRATDNIGTGKGWGCRQEVRVTRQ